MLCCIMCCFVMLWCVFLYCSILYCIMLYYTMLYYIVNVILNYIHGVRGYEGGMRGSELIIRAPDKAGKW